jgi:8-oxo-dGTP diphosphatase
MMPQEYTVVVVFRGDEVLLQYKLKGPFINVWNLPGGKVEEGENIAQCALRELFEETDIRVEEKDAQALLSMTYKAVCPARLHLFVTQVPKNTEFKQKEKEPLCWAKIEDVLDNYLPTAGYLNVPHFVALAAASKVSEGAII